ncbi:MAG: hypothetical protein CVV44_00300 [Spirochaetae bacterium HGW-Spirochaetae-1]|jgi:hypothetical protein|nr:MAG: hypothetical protein CVV44_00300 [Spirochaetae bacterium HGW-Spirochaetae-1]
MKPVTASIVILFLAFSGCSKEEADPVVSVGFQPVQSEGYWVDNDAWRISATGFAGEKNLDKPQVQRQELACTAAKLSAMAKAMLELGESDTASIKIKNREKGVDETAFSGFIRNGEVVEKNFNPDTNNCDIIFEIRESNLKNKVSSRP